MSNCRESQREKLFKEREMYNEGLSNASGLECEFCVEFNHFEKSRFAELYYRDLPSRIVYSNGEFLVIPTIGQILFGHSLILTKKHYCSFAEVPVESLDSLVHTIRRTEDALSRFGETILFEHGTSPKIGSGCGIYHAHIHVVPVADPIPPEFLLQDKFLRANSISEALVSAQRGKEYLLYRDTHGKFFVSFPKNKMESQYFRRMLVEYFGLETSWNWKEYGFEGNMVRLIGFFKLGKPLEDSG